MQQEDISIQSTTSVLMSGDVQTIEAKSNFYKNNLDWKSLSQHAEQMSQQSRLVQTLRNQVEFFRDISGNMKVCSEFLYHC